METATQDKPRVSEGLEADSARKKWCLTYGFVYLTPCPHSSKSFQVELRAFEIPGASTLAQLGGTGS